MSSTLRSFSVECSPYGVPREQFRKVHQRHRVVAVSGQKDSLHPRSSLAMSTHHFLLLCTQCFSRSSDQSRMTPYALPSSTAMLSSRVSDKHYWRIRERRHKVDNVTFDNMGYMCYSVGLGVTVWRVIGGR